MKKLYYLIVCGSNYERAAIECENYPTEQEIITAIKKYQGISARVEERYKLLASE